MKRAEVIRPSQPSFWMPGRPARNLSVTSLPSPVLRKRAAGNGQDLRRSLSASCHRRRSGGFRSVASRGVVDLAEIVVQAADHHPVGVRRDHLPRHQVVQRGAPQHGLLAAGVHRHVAADAGGIGRRRVDREHQAGVVGGFHHPRVTTPAPQWMVRNFEFASRAACSVSTALSRFEFFGIDDRGDSVSGTAPPV